MMRSVVRKFSHLYLCKSLITSMSRQVHQTTSEPIPTMHQLTNKLAVEMGFESVYAAGGSSRAHLSQYLPKSQKDLPPRAMRDSFVQGLIPLSSDVALQDKYTTFLGAVRLGRLLEDMDIFAVIVAHKHILNPALPANTPTPHTLVTALVDRIDFSNFVPKPHEDIKISGHVSWVGSSSMEVVVWLEQMSFSTWHRITRALFVIAARDSTNTKPAVVNPIAPADEREKTILAGGESRKQGRIKLEKIHVSRAMPDNEEQLIIHDLYLKTQRTSYSSMRHILLPPGAVWMEDCIDSTSILSQPDNRNLHNTVFGGFLMRQACELSFVLGFKFSKYRPKLKSLSDIKFNKPIAVNALIQMQGIVVFTHMQFIHILVCVDMFDPRSGLGQTTNTLHFTYEVPEVVRDVYPRTYHEAMMYIDGRRHFFEILKPTDDGTVDEKKTKSKL